MISPSDKDLTACRNERSFSQERKHTAVSVPANSENSNHDGYFDVQRASEVGKKNKIRRHTLSPDQLMAIAAQYAGVAGDRMRPAAIKRSFSIDNDKVQRSSTSSDHHQQTSSSHRSNRSTVQNNASNSAVSSLTNITLIEESTMEEINSTHLPKDPTL